MRVVQVLSSLLVASALLAPRASSEVLVVDGAGGGDHTTIQAAVDASADGDTILVRPGDYRQPFARTLLGSHALVLVGDVGGDVLVPPFVVSGLPADDFLVLRGFTIGWSEGAFGGPVLNLSIRDCAGPVMVEDCIAIGRETEVHPGSAGLHAVEVDESTVTFQRCTFRGGFGTSGGMFFPTFSGASALLATASDVALHDCILEGGHGGTAAGGLLGGNGGDGLVSTDSRVTISGSLCTGAAGGGGCTAQQVDSGCSGGSAVRQQGALAVLRDLDASFVPGSGGALSGGGTGLGGQEVELLAGTRTLLSGEAVGLSALSPLRSGEVGTLTLQGPPDRPFLLFVGFEPIHVPLLHFKGVFALGPPLQGPLVLGSIPPAGTLEIDYVAPDLTGFGLDALLLVGQVLVDEEADGTVLSAPMTHIQVAAGH